MDCEGLASAWERVEAVRVMCREKGLLLCPCKPGAGHCDSNRANALKNLDLLRICCERLYAADLKLPYLEPLQEEIKQFYKKIHVEVSEKIIYRSSVELKRMLSWLKRKANKKEVTKEPWVLLFSIYVNSISFQCLMFYIFSVRLQLFIYKLVSLHA